MDTVTITFFIRLAVAFLCGWIALELYRITKVIDSERLQEVVFRGAAWFGIFAFARFAASFLDSFLKFEIGGGENQAGIGIFSNVVNFTFYGGVIYLLYRYRRIFEMSEPDTSGKKKVAQIFDDLLGEMEAAKNRLQLLVK